MCVYRHVLPDEETKTAKKRVAFKSTMVLRGAGVMVMGCGTRISCSHVTWFMTLFKSIMVLRVLWFVVHVFHVVTWPGS